MTAEPKGHRWTGLIAAKIVCCGGLLLFATGLLSVAGTARWLADGGAWIGGGAAALAGIGLWAWRRRAPRRRPAIEPAAQAPLGGQRANTRRAVTLFGAHPGALSRTVHHDHDKTARKSRPDTAPRYD